MKYTINVTQEDIDKGIPMSCKHCPISQAIRRISGAEMVISDARWIRIGANPVMKSDAYRTPSAALTFITEYDKTPSDALPFTFDLHTFGDPS